MSVFNGDKLKIEFFGQSHSDFMRAKIYGLPKFNIDYNKLSEFIARRKSKPNAYSTSRTEPDKFEIKDTSKGLEITVANVNADKNDYRNLYGKPRPSHSDYCSFLKDGTLDFVGGGRFSGRLTVLLCIAGGICIQYLSALNVKICAFVSQVGSIKAFGCNDGKPSVEAIVKLRDEGFPSIDKKREIEEYLQKLRSVGDSVGSRVDLVADGVPAGLGDSYFEGLEGKIARIVYAIPAVKGVEFGLGFGFAETTGSISNDQMEYDEKGNVRFLTDNCGGIYGGISSGERLTMSVAFKPVPSISIKQKTVDLIEKKSCEIVINGRHDVCIAPRAVPCVESAAAIALTDEYLKNK